MPSLQSSNVVRFTSFVMVICLIGYLTGIESMNGISTHVLLGICLIFLCIAMATGKPVTVLYAMVIYLPFMGLVRRLLLVYLGPTSFDPMVLIEPVIVLLLGSYWFYHFLWRKDAVFVDTTTFKLIRLLILIDVLEILNPLQHGISVGLSGLMFYVVPLFWMILSRLHFNDTLTRRIVHTVFILGIILALYGLKQTYFGFFPFENTWVNLSGYTSLHVGNKLRAFSTPDNAQDYGVYLSLGIAISWAYILRCKFLLKCAGIIGLGIMGFALFMESARGPIVLTTFAIAITSIIAAKTTRARFVVGTIVSALIVVVFIVINHIPTASQSALISHQINGLAHPLNSQDSSLSGHSGRMFSGILEGIKMPIGHGLGSTTIAAGKFNSSAQGTEIDISNMFVSDGIVGGVLYLLIIGRIFHSVIRGVHKYSFLHLVTLGVLIAGVSQWSNGGLYSSSTIIWILIGYIDRRSSLQEQSPLSSASHRYPANLLNYYKN